MDTRFLLLARYNGIPIIPIHKIQEGFFHHLSLTKLLRKINDMQIALPIVRMEPSQKSAKGVHIEDLANYLDERRAEAIREFEAFNK